MIVIAYKHLLINKVHIIIQPLLYCLTFALYMLSSYMIKKYFDPHVSWAVDRNSPRIWETKWYMMLLYGRNSLKKWWLDEISANNTKQYGTMTNIEIIESVHMPSRMRFDEKMANIVNWENERLKRWNDFCKSPYWSTWFLHVTQMFC